MKTTQTALVGGVGMTQKAAPAGTAPASDDPNSALWDRFLEMIEDLSTEQEAVILEGCLMASERIQASSAATKTVRISRSGFGLIDALNERLAGGGR